MRETEQQPVKLRCPRCGRYLGEGTGYLRIICRDCGSEATYRSRDDRYLARPEIKLLTAS